jgi:hypothetical protein
MAYADRLALIKEIEEIRGSTVICYLTSVRPNVGAQIAEDAVRVFFDHLMLLPSRPNKIDIFLCSNGGSGVVPWRLISLLREYSDEIGVLLPFRAYSAATMFALGADEIVMHPFAEMGPIDPTVSNEFNPLNPITQQPIGISVEDVKAYVAFIKDTVGIRHEDELIEAVKILADKVHPLALGNVERFISQSRMIARKILLTHMKEDSDRHKIEDTIDTLASKLYFHGHPINRKEARDELGLKVAATVSASLETAMWKLYSDFEMELKNNVPFDPMSDIFRKSAAAVAAAVASGNPPVVPIGTDTEDESALAVIESSRLSSIFSRRVRFVVVGAGAQLEPIVRSESLRTAWDHQSAPAST